MKLHAVIFLLITTIMPMKAQESTASKNVSSFTLEAPQLSMQKKIWVYLPDGYAESSKKFPVIYMHDAQNLFDRKTAYSGEWRADEVLDSLQAQVIVIGIEHGNNKRMQELTPYKHPEHGGGNADAYLDFIVKTLMPYVEKNYRVKDGAKNTAIMGSSLGGLVSYYAVLKYPKVFGKAGVFSPSFWWSDEIYDLTIKTLEIKGRFYFMAGDSESKGMVPDMERMLEILKPKLKKQQNITSKIVKGGKHNEALWSKELAEALLWLMND